MASRAECAEILRPEPAARWTAALDSALEDAISRSRAVAVLIGPNGIGNTQQYERELALVRQTVNRTFPVIPVLLPGCEIRRPGSWSF